MRCADVMAGAARGSIAGRVFIPGSATVARPRSETAPCARLGTRSHRGERPAVRALAGVRCGRTRCRPPGGPGA